VRKLLATLLVMIATPALADANPDAVKAVKVCVGSVHKMHDTSQLHDDSYFKHFDAFYNPANGKIENNAYRNGDREPLYQFDKCMTEQGFPLS
jgi:hypothetical protein